VLPHQHINLCCVTGRLHPESSSTSQLAQGFTGWDTSQGSSFSSKRRGATESLAQLAASASSARVSECREREGEGEREREREGLQLELQRNASHRIQNRSSEGQITRGAWTPPASPSSPATAVRRFSPAFGSLTSQYSHIGLQRSRRGVVGRCTELGGGRSRT
jgi:hypothetical protein